MAKAKKKKQAVKSNNTTRSIFMAILFIAIAIGVALALLQQPSEPPQMDAKNKREEIIEKYVWRVYGLDILPKNAICAETYMARPVLNCVVTVRNQDNEMEDLRFWCSIEYDACVENWDQLAGIIEAKDKAKMGKSAKEERQEAISKALKRG